LHYSVEKKDRVQRAIDSFNRMAGTPERQVSLGLGFIIKAAVMIGKASPDNVIVFRRHVAADTCATNGSSCTLGTGCTATNLSDAEANEIGAALDNAATAVSGASALGAAKALAEQLGAAGDATIANSSRCLIFNRLLTQ
jgi:hypothetical protein